MPGSVLLERGRFETLAFWLNRVPVTILRASSTAKPR